MTWPTLRANEVLSGGAARHLLRDVYDRNLCAQQRGFSFAFGNGSTSATSYAALVSPCWRVPAWAGGRTLSLLARIACATGGGYVRLRDAASGNVGTELRVTDADGYAVFQGKPAVLTLAIPAEWAGTFRTLAIDGKCDAGTAQVAAWDAGLFANARLA